MSIFKPGTIDPSVPTPVPSNGQQVRGIDVYHNDDVRSWAKVKAAGYEFVFIKCSQNSPDPKFVEYWNGAKAAGLIVGGYHFMNYGVSGAKQAELAVSMLNKVSGGKDDFSLTCDWEYADGHDPKTSEIAIVQDFLKTAQSLTGRTPIIYCSNYLPNALGNPAWFRAYPLWVARYGAKPSMSNWKFWQYSESGSIPGIANGCDVNLFAGNLIELKQFVAAH